MSRDQGQVQGQDEGWDIVTGIGMTALAVAAARAVETSRESGLIKDPYAALLVSKAGASTQMPLTEEDLRNRSDGAIWPGMTSYMAIRTAVFDDYFKAAAESGVTQAVLLAAGLDSRAYRLEWPEGLTVYEIDQPAVLDYKLGVLREHGASPGCEHRPVPVDLRDDWAGALVEAGFDPGAPTAWLAEGLLPYLPPEAESQLFKEIHRLSGPGSRIAVEQISNMNSMLDDPMLEESATAIGVDPRELLHTDERRPVEEWLQGQGWVTRNIEPQESAEHYGREFEGPMPESMSRGVVHTLGELP